MNSWHLHIEGLVQGVGFRPFVYQTAHRFRLNGWVNNTVDGVHIQFNADPELADTFTEVILEQAPVLARITKHRLEAIEYREFVDFRIIHSDPAGTVNVLLTPDFGICPDCRKELHTPGDRREAYAFTTCTHCGPRYSIIRRLPYDRATTTMDAFPMCPTCAGEYEDPLNRRYYAQTNSCPACAIELSLIDREGNQLASETGRIIAVVAELLEAGRIVGIKGIGGYLLCCDAGNPAAIRTLRERKHRPAKPLALMYPSLESLETEFAVYPEAREELQSYRSPIVLLSPTKQNTLTKTQKLIAPGLDKIGVMLPYTPLYELLLQQFGRPLVATSGNISNAPIAFTDDQARAELIQIADLLLINNREIVVPQDDSVLQYSPFSRQKIILRRSRGMTPNYMTTQPATVPSDLLATGAMLKSTFALTHHGNIFISQYLGDLQNFATEEHFRHTLEHFLQLLAARPQKVLVDLHPDYPSTRLGRELAQRLSIPVNPVQHHLAHFGAVLGENQLIDSTEPVLGVIWDGTGLGEDGQLWGGEFMLYQSQQFSRLGHFEYFDFLLGDKMPREPRISALSLAWDLEEAQSKLQPKFTDVEWSLYRKMLANNTTSLQTSSMGRVFDAVASLIGLGDHQTYEGEAATKLEQLATAYIRKNGSTFKSSYFNESISGLQIPTRSVINGIVQDLRAGYAADYIAAKFHCTLAGLILQIAEQTGVRQIACSGGVFQNGLLVDLLLEELSDGYQLYLHRDLSPNDECIAFGQLIYYQIQQQNTYKHVLSDSR